MSLFDNKSTLLIGSQNIIKSSFLMNNMPDFGINKEFVMNSDEGFK